MATREQLVDESRRLMNTLRFLIKMRRLNIFAPPERRDLVMYRLFLAVSHATDRYLRRCSQRGRSRAKPAVH
jgi:hypothetical protein